MLSLALAASILVSGQTQGWPLTRAEKTNFNETSHYEDVVAFVRSLQANGAPVTLTFMGKSAKGREMPLIVASRPAMMTPAQAKKSGRPVIYIEANIHAGEVEGKEAAQQLLRKWCQETRGVLDKCVVVMTPIYNIDGNEEFGPVEKNRPEQDGPPVVGLRPNGQGLDLNRDCMKAESPEMRAVLEHVYNAWDPDVVIDLHTTDGTRHGYELTYSPPLNPNTDAGVLKFTRDEMLPAIRKQIRAEDHLELFDYGNSERHDNAQQWRTFGQEGRYVTNYAGLRNRIAVLSEATTYIPFKARVHATEIFVQRVVDYILKNGKRVVELTRKADEKVVDWANDHSVTQALGVRFDFDLRGTEEVLLEKPPVGGPAPITSRPAELIRPKMPVYDRFKVTRTALFPAAYLIPADEKACVELLLRHGIAVERFTAPCEMATMEFKVREAFVPQQPFQGHKLVRLEGDFQSAPQTLAAGSYVVRTNQPLGVLAFHLLEPESLDGVVSWGFIASPLKAGDVATIRKTFDPVRAEREVVHAP